MACQTISVLIFHRTFLIIVCILQVIHMRMNMKMTICMMTSMGKRNTSGNSNSLLTQI